MAVFKSSAHLTRCDECKLVFDPVYGGVCSRCRRLLCAHHLYGGFWRRVLAHIVPIGNPICVKCRSSLA